MDFISLARNDYDQSINNMRAAGRNVYQRLSEQIKTDPVSHPKHYTQGSVECIEAIRSMLSPEEYIGFLRGQVAKYNWRLMQKDSPLENAEKASWYLNELIALYREPNDDQA